MSLSDVLPMVLQLSVEEREELAEHLLLSLDAGPPDPGYEEAWKAELRNRLQKLDDGTSVTRPWSEVRDRIRQSLRQDPSA